MYAYLLPMSDCTTSCTIVSDLEVIFNICPRENEEIDLQ